MTCTILKTATYRFEFRFEEPVRFGNHPEIPVRKWLDRSLKRTLCYEPHGRCQECSYQTQCFFFDMFEKTELSPFVLAVPRDAVNLRRTDTLIVEITLFGKYRSCLPQLMVAFEHAGIQGYQNGGHSVAFYLNAIAYRTPSGWQRLWDVYNPILLDDYTDSNSDEKTWETREVESFPVHQATLKFHTPLCFHWVESDSPASQELQFSSFFSRLMNRVTQLNRLFGEKQPDWDHVALSTASQAIKIETQVWDLQTVSYYSLRKKMKIPFKGVHAQFTLSGPLTPLMPWLRLGEWIHVGRHVSFGFGKYQLHPN